jgi:hypothetical protein
MMIGYDIYICFYNRAFSIASKNDLDDQNLLLATVPTLLRGDQDGLFKLVTLNCILNRITGVTSVC